jgi:hypothetical protein
MQWLCSLHCFEVKKRSRRIRLNNHWINGLLMRRNSRTRSRRQPGVVETSQIILEDLAKASEAAVITSQRGWYIFTVHTNGAASLWFLQEKV